MFEIKDLNVILAEGDRHILKSVSMKIEPGEINVLVGKNGSGKSTLARSVLGMADMKVSGQILVDKEDIEKLSVTERARKGVFVSYQNPLEIEGVSYVEFLRNAYNSVHEEKDRKDIWSFLNILTGILKQTGLDSGFSQRNLNEGFSGGEKKKSEMVQYLLLKPKVAIFDEIDSGLDITAVKKIFRIIENECKQNHQAILIITHNPNIKNYIKVKDTYILKDGSISKTKDIESDLL